jgi:hypothetical protein
MGVPQPGQIQGVSAMILCPLLERASPVCGMDRRNVAVDSRQAGFVPAMGAGRMQGSLPPQWEQVACTAPAIVVFANCSDSGERVRA